MTTQKTILVVLEDCVVGAKLAGGLANATPAKLLDPRAQIGKFPGNGDPLADLIARGHRVTVVSRASTKATLSTAAYLYDLEYHHLEILRNGSNPFTDDHSSDLAAIAERSSGTAVVVVAGPQTARGALDPKIFFRTLNKNPAFAAVTSGKRDTSPDAPAVPAPGDPLYALHTELVRPNGWRLKQLNTLALAACSSGSVITAVRAAYWTLDAAPGVPSRSVLQERLLRGVASVTVEPKDFHVFDPRGHVFHFHPHLLTRREYRANPQLRSLYLAALADLFPPHTVGGVGGLNREHVRAVTPYASHGTNAFGSVMGIAKNWKRPTQFGSNGTSGQEVSLSYLPFAAELLAAYLPGTDDLVLVPVPSTPFSVQQPGEVSRRLGDLVHDVSGVSVAHVLGKSGRGISCTAARAGTAYLLDDQITRGRTLTAACVALTGAGYAVNGAVAFSVGGKSATSPSVTPPSPRGYPLALRGFTVPR